MLDVFHSKPSVWWMFLLLLAAAGAASATDLKTGHAIDDFSLRDFRGNEVSLSSLQDSKVVVVAFLGTECPLARLYAPRLNDIANRFGTQGVSFLGIDSNQQDNQEEIAAFARNYQINFPLLRDPGNVVADQFAAERTPEVFVLGPDRKVAYRGRIDNQYVVGVQRPEPDKTELIDAIEALLAGRPVSVPAVPSVGCHIGRVVKVAPTGDITYTKHISRILQERCIECHREGEIAPFPLTTFEDAVAWGETIVEVIHDGRMPPWFADPKYGTFLHDGRMPENEKELLRAWVANGSPQGSPEDLPPPREYLTGWGMPEPDAVYSMSDKPFLIPAEGVIDYQNYTVDPGWTEDKWIKGAEARPGNRAVVHHILVFIRRPNKFYLPALPGELVAAYAPGMKPTIAHTDDMAVLAPAGSKIVFQMHYTPNGREEEDISKVGFNFADPADIKYEIKAGMAINVLFRIPPHHNNFPVNAAYVCDEDTRLLGVNPHMHLRGKSFRYEAIYPDGKREILMDCPRFDFNWQLGYQYAEPIKLPKGTKIVCTAHFDNSEENLSNPDPSITVTFGEQTWEEMMIGWFFAATKRK